MAVKSHRLGPGQLTFGDPGSPQEFGAALRNCRVVPTADDGDTIPVLSGDELFDVGEETWTLEGSILQSYDAESLLIWCNQNSGQEMTFTFKPINSEALEVTGTALIRSVQIGGDVKERNESDFSFRATDVEIGGGAGATGMAMATSATPDDVFDEHV